MGKELLKILISVIISSAVSYLLALRTFDRQNFIEEKGRLDELENKITDINLQYPYLEDSSFIQRWNAGEIIKSDSSIRYLNYCNYIFNFAESALEFYKYDTVESEKHYDLKALVKPHCGWWKLPPIEDSTEDKSKKIIDSYCK